MDLPENSLFILCVHLKHCIHILIPAHAQEECDNIDIYIYDMDL